MKHLSPMLLGMIFAVLLPIAVAAEGDVPSLAPKPASQATIEAQRRVLASLPFADEEDFRDATRGFMAVDPVVTIDSGAGYPAWDLEPYRNFISADLPSPDSVNPSLWRNAKLVLQAGLFEVVPGRIYQVRTYDISNMTFIKGDTGWIILDTLTSRQTARAAYELVTKHLGARPIKAVIYSHSHTDHYGGIRGVVEQEDIDAGRVEIIASPDFLYHVMRENITAGNAMIRRSLYMYGSRLRPGDRGLVGAGLGLTTPRGDSGLIAPTRTIARTGEKLVIDGVEMVFQLTPGTEAPTEMNTYFPQFKALWLAENCNATLHNLYTLRGAEIRDGLKWAKYIDEAIRLFGDETEVKFQSHHWPKWGKESVRRYMEGQRDIYRFIHDQTVRLFNQGYTDKEVAEALDEIVPPALRGNWSTRSYYGTVKHNAKAVYQMYLGWFDGNPANLDPLPPEAAAAKYVEYMGGVEAILTKTAADMERGEYRFAAEALKHAVFAHPDNRAARLQLADCLEQMGYQAESGPWRNVYLQGAFELRHGAVAITERTNSPDMLAAMPAEDLFDYMAVHVNGKKAGTLAPLRIRVNLAGVGDYILVLENGVLHNYPAASDDKVSKTSAVLFCSKLTLIGLVNHPENFASAMEKGLVVIQGKTDDLVQLFGTMEAFDTGFEIVVP